MKSSNGQQFLRFCAAGGVGLVVDASVLYATAPFLGWYGARVLSFLAAATATWWLNRRYTFVIPVSLPQARQPTPVLRQYFHYLLSMLLGGCVNYGVYVATLQWVHVPGSALLGVALGSCAGLCFNFLTARYLVFRTDRHSH